MATNRTHQNPKEVIENFMGDSPKNAIILLVLSINNFLNNEIKTTVDQNPPQTSLLFMGIHASILTLSEVLFNLKGPKGYKKFLEEFIDEGSEDKCFSLIANEIHAWRNTLAHSWLSLRGHDIDYEYGMPKGFEEREGTIYINPKIYLDLYLRAFNSNRILLYVNRMSEADLLKA